MKLQENILLKNYTTIKIGGPAKYFCIIENKEDLIEAVAFAKKERLPCFILGGGSKLLVSDNGFKGLVIKIENCERKIADSKVIAGAGLGLAKLLSVTADAGLSGLEWSSGIPGATVGGAARGNAGAFDSEIKDIISRIEALNTNDLKFKTYDLKECGFDYRTSVFKKNPNLIIWSCELKFKKEEKGKIKNKIKEILNYRKGKHPKEPSAGSIFKNIEPTPTALLIHQCGLSGKQIGKAKISEKHSNFIVNLGGAKAKDVLELIDLAKKEVKSKFGIVIEEEIQLLGDF